MRTLLLALLCCTSGHLSAGYLLVVRDSEPKALALDPYYLTPKGELPLPVSGPAELSPTVQPKVIGSLISVIQIRELTYALAYVPEAEHKTLLLSYDHKLQLQKQTELDGKPLRLSYAADPGESLDAPSPTPTPTVGTDLRSALTPTPTARHAQSPMQALKGGFEGDLRDAVTHALISASAEVGATNSRGKLFAGTVENGRYLIPSLNWGSYSIVVECPGYQRLIHPRAVLAGKKNEVLDLELSPLPEPQK